MRMSLRVLSLSSVLSCTNPVRRILSIPSLEGLLPNPKAVEKRTPDKLASFGRDEWGRSRPGGVVGADLLRKGTASRCIKCTSVRKHIYFRAFSRRRAETVPGKASRRPLCHSARWPSSSSKGGVSRCIQRISVRKRACVGPFSRRQAETAPRRRPARSKVGRRDRGRPARPSKAGEVEGGPVRSKVGRRGRRWAGEVEGGPARRGGPQAGPPATPPASARRAVVVALPSVACPYPERAGDALRRYGRNSVAPSGERRGRRRRYTPAGLAPTP